jgi:hypothetical protein
MFKGRETKREEKSKKPLESVSSAAIRGAEPFLLKEIS